MGMRQWFRFLDKIVSHFTIVLKLLPTRTRWNYKNTVDIRTDFNIALQLNKWWKRTQKSLHQIQTCLPFQMGVTVFIRIGKKLMI